MGRARRSVGLLADHTAGNTRRYVDLSVSLRVADVDRLPDGSRRWRSENEEELLLVGGRWDRREKAWSGAEARTARVLRVHRGQEAAARWLADWFRRYGTGDWSGFHRVFSALLVGGRRSGKTHLSLVALVVFAVMNPGTTIWAVSPTEDTGDELDQALLELLPVDWRTRSARGANKVITYRLANRSRIILRSGARAGRLKAGKVDFALLNEGQMHSRSAFTKLRSALDTGGLVLIAANPPDSPIGRWVEDQYTGAASATIDAVAFDFDPRGNPWIDQDVLLSLAKEEDEKTYQREVLGLFTPIGDVVFHAWSDRDSLRDPPLDFIDVTADVTKRELGRAAGYVVGLDFQQTPAMVGIVCKFFVDPADVEREPLLWIVDEVVAERADEQDLLDELERLGRWTPTRRLEEGYRGWREEGDAAESPVHCAGVLDASAWWQDGAHSRGRTSDRVFRARRWSELHRPQSESNRNPDRIERCKVTNARLKAASGRRRMFVARHCVRTAEALRKWEIRNGAPYSRSPFAHVADATSYVAYRFFGRPPLKRSKSEYRGARHLTRAKEMKGVFR